MGDKRTVSMSIDRDVHNKAKQMGYNISGECEHALRIRTQATKKDSPEEQLRMKCHVCGSIVEEGYLCRERNLFVCLKCHPTWNCHVTEDMHEHIRIPYKTDRDRIEDDLEDNVALSGSLKQ